MKIIIMLLSVALAAGCSKSSSGSECEKLFDHTLSLMPAELKSKVKDSKADAIAKCEKLSPEARSCAMAATSMADLMKCPRS